MTRNEFISEFNKLNLGSLKNLIVCPSDKKTRLAYILRFDYGDGKESPNVIGVLIGEDEGDALDRALLWFKEISPTLNV